MDAITQADLQVTLSKDLLTRLREEATRLEIPLEYLVAGLVLDTLDEPRITRRAG